ncbi:MAG: MlaD family protein [Acidobacteriota bacterium]|nr:MlaD family protein [Acidobacteriota bacterium]
MNKQNIGVGIFVIVAVSLFTAGLFLIGDQHKAFRHHDEFYTEFANVDGVGKGAKVRVAGMAGGQVTEIEIPNRPSQKFRLKLQVEDRLHGLIRTNSLVTIESAGVVGDKYLLIHEGTDQAAAAAPNSTLGSKEPLQISALLEKASGIMDVAGSTITDVRGKLDGALQAVTTTVDNTNGIVTGIRAGRGTAGMLLEDPATAAQVKQAVANSQQATQNLNRATVQVNDLLTDFRSRNLFAKTEATLDNARSASHQVDQASQQINQTLTGAFGEDQFGENAGSNLRQSLSNINIATGNLADDTEAVKHEFFFRGFFKKRGYDTLHDLPADQYRSDALLTRSSRQREWLASSSLFTVAPDGREMLSAEGRQQIDRLVAQLPNVYGSPLLVEGYSDSGSAAENLIVSRRRAVLVRKYLQVRFHLQPKNLGVIALSSTPPASAGKSTWDGACLVLLAPRK